MFPNLNWEVFYSQIKFHHNLVIIIWLTFGIKCPLQYTYQFHLSLLSECLETLIWSNIYLLGFIGTINHNLIKCSTKNTIIIMTLINAIKQTIAMIWLPCLMMISSLIMMIILKMISLCRYPLTMIQLCLFIIVILHTNFLPIGGFSP